MINSTVLAKLDQVAQEHREKVEARRRLNNLANKVLHVPRAPSQRIYEDTDPRTRKIKKVGNLTAEEEKLRQFTNTAIEVENDSRIEFHRRQLFGVHSSSSTDNNNDPSSTNEEEKQQVETTQKEMHCLNLIQRPQSARSAMTTSKQKEDIRKQAMTPRMRPSSALTNQGGKSSSVFTDSRNYTSFDEVKPHQPTTATTTTNFVSHQQPRSSFKAFSSGSNLLASSDTEATSSHTHQKKSGVSFAAADEDTETIAKSEPPPPTRHRIFSMIDVVDCDDEEDDDFSSSVFQNNFNNTSTRRRSSGGSSAAAVKVASASSSVSDDVQIPQGVGTDCDFQFFEKQRRRSSGTVDPKTFLQLDTMQLETPKTPPKLLSVDGSSSSSKKQSVRIPLGRTYSSSTSKNSNHQTQQQLLQDSSSNNAFTNSMNSNNSSLSSPTCPRSRSASRALLAQQRKSVVSGIWGQPQEKEKVKVNVEGDLRLRVIEQQWSWSPNRKFPKLATKKKNTSSGDALSESFLDHQKRKLRENHANKHHPSLSHQDNGGDGDDQIRLQCVVEYEKERAKDQKELAVTFTERYLKVKDGSCRPLKSRFTATVKREEELLLSSVLNAKKKNSPSRSNEEEDNNKNTTTTATADADNNSGETSAVSSSLLDEEPTPFVLDDMMVVSSTSNVDNNNNNNNNNNSTCDVAENTPESSSSTSPTIATDPSGGLVGLLLGKCGKNEKTNKNNQKSSNKDGGTTTIVGGRLPRSSWHVDFAVQEPEKETWKCFTKKFYEQANCFANLSSDGVLSTSPSRNQQITVKRRKITDNYNDSFNDNNNDDDEFEERNVYISSSLLKNVTISGCAQGFDCKKFEIPDPPSIEEVLHQKEQQEELINDMNDNRDVSPSLSPALTIAPFVGGTGTGRRSSFLGASSNNNNNNQTTTPALSRTASLSQAALSRATSDLPASLRKAESFRRSPSTMISSSSASPSSSLNRNTGSKTKLTATVTSMSHHQPSVAGALARFRSRKYFESAAKLREQEAEQAAREEEERIRREHEEERKRKKAILLESFTLLQCSLDDSAKFFRKLAREDRLLVKAINLEHCKLPRKKSEDESSSSDDGDKDDNEDKKSSSSVATNSLKTVSPSSTHYSITPPVALLPNTNNNTPATMNSLNSSVTNTPQSRKIPNIRIVSPLARSLNSNNIITGGSSGQTRPLLSLTTPRERALQMKRERGEPIHHQQQVRHHPPLCDEEEEKEEKGPTRLFERRNTLPPSNDEENNKNGNKNRSTKPSLRVAFVEHTEEDETTIGKKKDEVAEQKSSSVSSSSSSSSDDEDQQQQYPWMSDDVEEEFAEAFLDEFVTSQASTLTSLSFHGTRFTETFLEKLAELIRSNTLTKLQHLDIGLCGIESMDETPYCAKVMASAIAHAPPSLTSLSIVGTAMSPHFVGITFCAGIRANVNLLKVDCVGCDRGGTRFEVLIQRMLDERKELVEKRKARLELKKKRSMRRLQSMVRVGSASIRSVNPSAVNTQNDSNDMSSIPDILVESENDDDGNEDEEEEEEEISLAPVKSVALIENEELF